MTAMIQERYGAPAEVPELRPIARPVPGAGEVLAPVLATYPLAEVAEAVRFGTDGHARGQDVVTVGEHKNERTQ